MAKRYRTTKAPAKRTLTLEDKVNVFSIFASNITFASRKARTFIAKQQDDVIAVSETHLDEKETKITFKLRYFSCCVKLRCKKGKSYELNAPPSTNFC